MAACTVVNSKNVRCTRQSWGGPLCGTHRGRLHRNGDVMADKPIRHYTKPERRVQRSQATGSTPEERHWQRVQKGIRCWVWTGAKNQSGVGISYLDGFAQSANRVSWQIRYGSGSVPPGAKIRSACDTTGCVRPEHLEMVLAASTPMLAAA